jgi:hypothetical protein
LRTLVGKTLRIPAIRATHIFTAAVFFAPIETDNDNGANAAEILWRVLWAWNPHIRVASAIH